MIRPGDMVVDTTYNGCPHCGARKSNPEPAPGIFKVTRTWPIASEGCCPAMLEVEGLSGWWCAGTWELAA